MFITLLDVISFFVIMFGAGAIFGMVVRILFWYKAPRYK